MPMRKSGCWNAVLLCGLAFLVSAGLQELSAQGMEEQNPGVLNPADMLSSAVIRVSTNLVMVPVSVTDAAGRAVQNLKQDDFQIIEDGNSEAISKMAEAGQSPLQLVLLLDLSRSVNSKFEFEQQAAIRFLKKVMKPGDSVSILSFNDKPQIRLRNSTSLSEAIQDLLELRPTESATAFYDSVVASFRLLRESSIPEARKAEIVLSDGEDNRSDRTIADAFREVQRSDTILYSINPGGNSIRLNEISLKGQQELTSLANETGGSAFVSDESSNLDEIFGRIATELRAQYLLAYYSSNPHLDGKFRRIVVSIPGRPDLRIHARQGYYAVEK